MPKLPFTPLIFNLQVLFDNGLLHIIVPKVVQEN